MEDPYFWLRDDDRKDRDVLRVIHEENKCVGVCFALCGVVDWASDGC